jgi:flagellar biosynthetic protein FliQ
MQPDLAVDLLRDALLAALVLVSPVLITLAATSFVMTLLQTLTNLQDVTLSLTPKLVIGALATLALLPWMIDRLTTYSSDLYRGILTAL